MARRFGGDAQRTEELIAGGVRRLAGFQHRDGLFSLWGGGDPDTAVTARVAHRLMALRADAGAMLDRAREALVREKHRDNQLVSLDPRFRDAMRTVRDAVALFDADRDEAHRFLSAAAVADGESAYWEGEGYWGGRLEATADATRVLHAARDPLFRRGFNYIGARVTGGMLYSTADTRAMIELFASIGAATRRALIDGREIALAEPCAAREVQALDDDLIVRVDEERTIDWLASASSFAFDVDVRPTAPKLGDRVSIRVKLREESLCPLARVYLPGCLAWVRGGANAQSAYVPVIDRALELEAVAVRPGRGAVRTAVHDLYDAAKIGTARAVEVRVAGV